MKFIFHILMCCLLLPSVTWAQPALPDGRKLGSDWVADYLWIRYQTDLPPEEAARRFERLKTAAPDSALTDDAALRIGTQLSELRHYDQAIPYFDFVIAQAGADLLKRAYSAKLHALLELGDERAALSTYKQFLWQFPGGNAEISGRMAAAFPNQAAPETLFDSPDDYYAYVKRLLQQQPLASADPLIARALRMNLPTEARAYLRYQHARYLQTQGKKGEAMRHFRDIANDYPALPIAVQATWEIAGLHRDADELEKAAALYTELSQSPNARQEDAWIKRYWLAPSFSQDPDTILADYGRLFPNSQERDKLVWDRIWKLAVQGNREDAWQRLKSHSFTYSTEVFSSRILFWKWKLGGDVSAKDQLLARYPFSYYAYRLSESGHGLKPSALRRHFRWAGFKLDPVASQLFKLGFGDTAVFYLEDRLKQPNLAAFAKDSLVYSLATLHLKMGHPSKTVSVVRAHHWSLSKDRYGFIPFEYATLLYPRPYWNAVAGSGKEFEINPYFILSVMREESEYQPKARSRSNALGLMQIKPSTGVGIAKNLKIPWEGEATLLTPNANIRMGTQYLYYLNQRFDRNFHFMLSGYNAGPNFTGKWIQKPEYQEVDWFVDTHPYRETHYYMLRVLKSYWVYQIVYRDTPRPTPSSAVSLSTL